VQMLLLIRWPSFCNLARTFYFEHINSGDSCRAGTESDCSARHPDNPRNTMVAMAHRLSKPRG